LPLTWASSQSSATRSWTWDLSVGRSWIGSFGLADFGRTHPGIVPRLLAVGPCVTGYLQEIPTWVSERRACLEAAFLVGVALTLPSLPPHAPATMKYLCCTHRHPPGVCFFK